MEMAGRGAQPRNASFYRGFCEDGMTLGPRDVLCSCVLSSCYSSWDPGISSVILLTEESHGFLGEETQHSTCE